MKQKSILSLILAAIVILCISLVGCGSRNGTRNNAANLQDESGTTRGNMFEGTTGYSPDGTINNNADMQGDTSNNVNDNTNNNTGNISDATRNRIEATADSIRYSAGNFRDDLSNAGYNVTDSTNTRSNYFRGNESEYLLGGDVVRLFEYNSAADLEGDMTRIAPDGMTINGTNASFTRRPYYYRKGNTLIMYEGNEPAYIDEFRNMYGNTIVP